MTFIGSDVTVKVSNTLQTATGRMVFATLTDGEYVLSLSATDKAGSTGEARAVPLLT